MRLTIKGVAEVRHEPPTAPMVEPCHTATAADLSGRSLIRRSRAAG
jgi:hypothetical protein